MKSLNIGLKVLLSFLICNFLLCDLHVQKRKLAVDGINQLPDEMLIHILSSLNLKEAVRTSVLSSRWRYLWCLSGNFDIDLDCWIAKRNKRIKAHRFEKLVNRIIKSHKAPSLHKFIVRCSKMLEGGTVGVCDWIRFAMQKNARVFRLDLQSQDFPDLEKFLWISRQVKHDQGSGFCSLLTSFTLVSVNITDGMIEHLLSSCPSLEHLCIMYDKHLTNLQIKSPSLKSLAIKYCSSLGWMTLDAANLVSLNFRALPSTRTIFLFWEAGALSELEMEGTYCFSFTHFVQVHSKYSRHLEKLVWRNNHRVPTSNNVFDVYPSQRPLPQLECLKHLELVTSTYASLVYFLLLTKACPLLATFVVQGVKHDRSCLMIKKPTLQIYRSENAQEFLKCYRHEHLKVVKLIDIGLYRSEFRFALGLIQIAKSIEKLIIVPGPLVRGTERMTAVRERAKQLEASLPPGARLVMI